MASGERPDRHANKMFLSAVDQRGDGAAAGGGVIWLSGRRHRITFSVFHWAANQGRDDDSEQLAKHGKITSFLF